MKYLWDKIVSLAGSNFGLKVLAVVIAVGLWVAGHRDVERAVEVPVEFRNIPSDLMVLDNRVDYVVLRLTGPRTLVSTLDAGDLKLGLDLDGAKPGSVSYPLAPSSFSIPRGVTVARITPPVIHLQLEPVLRRVVPVAVRFVNKPPVGHKVAETSVEPERVSVLGPAEEVRRLVSVETVPIDLEDNRSPIKRRVRLSTGGKPFSLSPDQVEVVITFEEEEISRVFGNIDVQAKGFKGQYNVSPRSAYLRISGPRHIIEKLELGTDEVYLNLKGLAPGEHSVPLSVSLPPEVKVTEQKPQRFKVRITKAGA
ncbi:MAG TPA: CdaR family protein [Candidatus Binatia bacterium]|nr:CdaR family protein [Candidatus Binatia bacterium]